MSQNDSCPNPLDLVARSDVITPFDREIMQRCFQLARQAAGKTAPNPLVGSVVVQAGTIVGEGFHSRAGQPHAEVLALQAAGDRAQGSTVYVNLEPCHHYGRTPPCTEALIAAQVAKVVVGIIDPDPRVSGRGVQRLRAAGIDVVVNVEAAAARQLNEGFIHRVQHQKPFGIFKYAMTLDGKIATETGHSAWVTGPQARQWVHQLRASCDAVIVGGNTVRQDDPHLTVHGVADHNPLRVVMSRQLDLPRDRHLWDQQEAKTVVFTESGANLGRQPSLVKQQIEVVPLAMLTPRAVMVQLYERGCATVLWECGGTLAAQAIADGAIQKVMAFIAPKIIGGSLAPSPVGRLGLTTMTEALPLEQMTYRSIASDLLIEGYLSSS